VHDVRQCVTMDLKEPGNDLYLIGVTRNELGGSHYYLVTGQMGGSVPKVDLQLAPKIFKALHAAIAGGLVRSCHDLKRRRLGRGACRDGVRGRDRRRRDGLTYLDGCDNVADDVKLFSESTTRFVVEVKPEHAAAFRAQLKDVPLSLLGKTRCRCASANRRQQRRMAHLGEARRTEGSLAAAVAVVKRHRVDLKK